MKKSLLAAILATFALGVAQAGDTFSVPNPAASIDDGLGALPHYSQWHGATWLYAMPAESIDSGLGEMPHVSQITEVWLYAQPAEKLDSGLGELARAIHESQDPVALNAR